jgi:hypothetical protein
VEQFTLFIISLFAKLFSAFFGGGAGLLYGQYWAVSDRCFKRFS